MPFNQRYAPSVPFGQETVRPWPGKPWESPQERPLVLRLLAAGVLATSFLEGYIVSNVQFLRTPAGVMAALLVAGFILLRLGRGQWVSGPAYAAVLFLVMVSTAQACHLLFDIGPAGEGQPLPAYLQYVQVVILYLVVYDLARDPRTVKAMAVALVGSTILMSIVANAGIGESAIQYNNTRAGVGGINLNGQAFLYSVSIVGIVGWTLIRWPRYRWFDAVLMVGVYSMLLASMKTASRGGTASLAVGILCTSILCFRRDRLRAYVVIVPLLIGGFFLMSPRAELLKQRIDATVYEDDTGMRVELAQGAMELIPKRPLIGFGADYSLVLGRHMGRNRPIAAHGTPTQITLSFGLLGFFPWILLIAVLVRIGWRSRSSPWGAILLSLLVTTLGLCVVANFGYDQYVWILFALVSRVGTLADVPIRDPLRRSVPTGPRPMSGAHALSPFVSRSNGVLQP